MPRRRRWRSIPHLAPLVLACALGCEATAPVTRRIGWRFIDGRRCDDSGAAMVSLAIGGRAVGEPGGYRCSIGEDPSRITLADLPIDSTLTITALSPAGAALYRGDVWVSSESSGDTIASLYFTGGR